MTRRLGPGIISPLPTFFLPDSEDLGVPFRITPVFRCTDAREECRSAVARGACCILSTRWGVPASGGHDG